MTALPVDASAGQRRPLVLAAGAVALMVGAAVGWSMFGGNQRAATRERTVPVTVASASRKAMPVEIATFGRVQTISSVALRSRIDGVIANVKVQEGQDVNVGDVLFSLDDREARAKLRQAEGAVARDKAQLDNARRDLDRLTPLEEKSFVSRQQIDLARANVAALEGTLAANTANAENARVQVSYTTITAPIAGRIGSIASKVGNAVRISDAQPLLTINQLRPIYIGISVPQRDFPALQQAMADGPVQVQASVAGDSTPIEVGQVSFVENAVDNMTNTVGIKATIPNDKNVLWPGQLVDVLITLKVEQDAIVIPSQAVQVGPDGQYVFAVGADDKAAMKPVTVARIIGAESVITSGIAAGEKVVTAGQVALEPGTKVSVRSPNAAQAGAKAAGEAP